MDLKTFLLARIAEDEAVARAGVSGQADPENGWGYEGRALVPHVGVIHEAVQAAHIVRWHPYRVLAECAAKRAILDIHSDKDGDCARCSDYAWFAVLDGGEREEFPCPTVRALAAVYADHPDYQPEWAQEASQA